MSGTSLDGLDGVLVRWHAGRTSFETLSRASDAFDAALRRELLALNAPGADELHRAALAANRMSLQAAAVVEQLLHRAGVQRTEVAAIGLHGQTVRHRPGEFDGHGYTLQLHNASLLAERTGVDVVCDFRSRDVAAGGQGAPLVPAFHAGVFHDPSCDVAVLNLGGIANLTLLPAGGPIGGFDCGPANVLMDLWAQAHLGQAFDGDGAWAASGLVQPDLLGRWQAEPFFSKPAPKSTGRDLFSADWLHAVDLSGYRPQDVQASLCELTAWCVDEHLRRHLPQAARLWVCGGGALNADLMRRIERRFKAQGRSAAAVTSTQAAGLDPLDVEAAAFAWLAWRFLQREPGNVVGVTGARGPRILGALYPGAR
ncbi:MAG: anhydro-N-acetylmuramic acid kinase [Betaproteobacteria bacterium]|nr:anhydro-N-acetylmuramic acid kinase [Betaproteobacteria bacterium]